MFMIEHVCIGLRDWLKLRSMPNRRSIDIVKSTRKDIRLKLLRYVLLCILIM
jgi:hypothetical protein